MGISTTNVAIVVVVLLSGWLMFGFSTSAQHDHEAALTASRLETAIADVFATEWHARAEGKLSPSIATELGDDFDQAERLIAKLPDAARRPLVSSLREFRVVFEAELDFLRRGAADAANRVNLGQVDPAFHRLERDLQHTSADASAEATSALRWLQVGSALVLFGAGTLIALIARLSRRRQIRVVTSSERAQVSAVSERRFCALVNNGDDVIIVTDRNGAIQEVSDSMSHVLRIRGCRRGTSGHHQRRVEYQSKSRSTNCIHAYRLENCLPALVTRHTTRWFKAAAPATSRRPRGHRCHPASWLSDASGPRIPA